VTFSYCRNCVDAYALVTEAEIIAAMKLVIERHHTMIEGAAGVAVAALLQQGQTWRGKRVAVVLCGANISLSKLRVVLSA
jgi:threonine dehydratase